MTDRTTPPPERRMSEVDTAAMKQAVVEELNAGPKPKFHTKLPRPRLAWAGGAATLAAAILVLVALFPSGRDNSTSSDVLDRAAATLEQDGKIFHVEIRADQSPYEVWFDSNAFHYVDRSGKDDTIKQEIAANVARTEWYLREDGDQQINVSPPIKAAPGLLSKVLPARDGKFDLDQLRELIGGGKKDQVKVVGESTTTYRGMPARRVDLAIPQPGVRTVTVTAWFAERTYYPLEVRMDAGEAGLEVIRFTTFEALPKNARTMQLLNLSPHPGVRVCKSKQALPPGFGGVCPPGTKQGTVLNPLQPSGSPSP